MASTQPTHPEAMSENSSTLALPPMHPSPSLSSVSSKKSSKRDSNRSDDAHPLDSVKIHVCPTINNLAKFVTLSLVRRIHLEPTKKKISLINQMVTSQKRSHPGTAFSTQRTKLALKASSVSSKNCLLKKDLLLVSSKTLNIYHCNFKYLI
jgi:hypothetical protein